MQVRRYGGYFLIAITLNTHIRGIKIDTHFFIICYLLTEVE